MVHVRLAFRQSHLISWLGTLDRAHRGNGKRFVVCADEKLTAFIELESVIWGRAADTRWNHT
jgi:hypothetical protein